MRCDVIHFNPIQIDESSRVLFQLLLRHRLRIAHYDIFFHYVKIRDCLFTFSSIRKIGLNITNTENTS